MSNTTRTLGIVAIEPKGEYDATAYYEKLNAVVYNDSTYMALRSSTGVLPTDTEYWQLIGGGVKKEDTILTFNTVAELKSSNIKNGMTAQTLGYYSANDGGGATYKIKTTSTSYYEELNNGLVAELNIEKEINVLAFGVDKTGTNDNSSKINTILTNYVGNTIYFPAGEYLFNSTVYIDENTTIKGDGKNSTIFTTNSAINILELKNSFSYNVSVENIGFNGNYVGLIGIYFHKTETSLETVDMRIRLEHLAFTRFTDWCLKIGGDTSERVIADSYYNDINCAQFTGGGILLTSRCTDSYFNNIRVGGGSIAGKENIVVRGYNLHFSNCKSFYSGTEQTPKDAWLFENCGCLYGEIEAQDSTGYGVKIDSVNAFNLSIMADRCTLATDDIASVYVTNSHYGSLKINNSNYEGSVQFGSNKVLKIYNCYNLELELFTTNIEKLIEIASNDNSYNIDYKINGYEIIDITPEFETINYNDNGITAKSVGNNQILVDGISTAQVDLALKGAYGDSQVLSMIPKNSLVKFITNNDYSNDAFFQVFNITTVLTSANQKILTFDSDTNVTGIVLRIPNGTTIKKILTPRILVVKNIGGN